MKPTPQDIARALIETCQNLPQQEVSDAIDAALHLLHVYGLGKDMRTFSRTVKDVFAKEFGVTSATLLTHGGDASGTEQAIIGALEKALGKSVDLNVTKDSSLLGGALLHVGDERFDASLRGALQRVQQHLTAISPLVS